MSTASLTVQLRALRLSSMSAALDDTLARAEQKGMSFAEFLSELVQAEVSEREHRRTARNLKSSRLPTAKTLATLNQNKLPPAVRKRMASLISGAFLDKATNVLAFGLPGRGKTHLVCAIGHELVRAGYKIYFTPTYVLVQRLLAAKRDLCLEKELARLDRYDAIILDDIGYVQQDRDEMEVLFTFLAQRYERKSVMITSNLVFSKWDQIFKDPMTTAAAIDRLVHHSVILELDGPSYRVAAAQDDNQK